MVDMVDGVKALWDSIEKYGNRIELFYARVVGGKEAVGALEDVVVQQPPLPVEENFVETVLDRFAAGHDLDASTSVFDDARNKVRAFPHRVLLAAGEDAGDAEVHQLLDRGERVGRDVEGAMKH